jgi:hypothetical protein
VGGGQVGSSAPEAGGSGQSRRSQPARSSLWRPWCAKRRPAGSAAPRARVPGPGPRRCQDPAAEREPPPPAPAAAAAAPGR